MADIGMQHLSDNQADTLFRGCNMSVTGADLQVFADAWNRHVRGHRGVSEWTFTGTRADGARVEVTGCSVFTFRDGKIAVKNSYRKNRPPLPTR